VIFYADINEQFRQAWLRQTLTTIEPGLRVLDAGAGEQRNRVHCGHLKYVSQDFGQYSGVGDGIGLHTGTWDTSGVDLTCDITEIPQPDGSFDVILCSEVLEHVPSPTKALDEFARLLRPGGRLILTAPFASIVHFAPYHFCTGFSRYWYEHHLPSRGLRIAELTANGDWFSLCRQELARLGGTARKHGYWCWPFAYLLGAIGMLYFKLQGSARKDDSACFGWQCVAIKE
jgi:SAM-dependent methyltransferase